MNQENRDKEERKTAYYKMQTAELSLEIHCPGIGRGSRGEGQRGEVKGRVSTGVWEGILED